MNFIVVGCGRVGAELCYHLFKGGHQVVVVDVNKESFNRLHQFFARFRRTIFVHIGLIIPIL